MMTLMSIFLLQFPKKTADMKGERMMMSESGSVDDRNITECPRCKKPFLSGEKKGVCTGMSGCE